MIYGGTKYKAELARATKYLGIIAELRKVRRAIQLSAQEVDEIGQRLKQQITDPRFNDEHLVALVIVSRCRLVCTNDNVAIYYLKLPACYSGHPVKRPKIYRSRRNVDLCCDRYLAEVCR